MKLNEVFVYVRWFRVSDIQIAIAVFTYQGVEFWPGNQRIVMISSKVTPCSCCSNLLKAFL